MIIAVGSDHAGFEEPLPYYKPAIVEHLKSMGHDVIDCGTYGPGSVDYPDYADKVCDQLLDGAAEYGVLLCGTGIGIGIEANRHKGIRAAVCVTPEMAQLAREHNNANVITMGRRLLTLPQCFELMDLFLSTPFSGGERHQRRIEKMG
jgi:ribose 5-phosphate isomerase B